MSRRVREEVSFGSDSFLDVIANIVGILIILIVLAGLHISQTPFESEAAMPAMAVAAQPVAAPQVSPELIRRISALESELAGLDVDSKTQTAQLEAATAHGTALDSQLESTSNNVLTQSKSLEGARNRAEEIRESILRQERELAALRSDIRQAEREKTTVTKVEHKLTPLSRKVSGKEIHFRLAENRVAYVPIEALAERLQPQIQRQKERLLEQKAVDGEVGPVDGFTMSYIVARRPVASLPGLEEGQMLVRIELSQWQIVPEPDLQAESGDEALRKGSAFLRNLRSSKNDVTVTFWVYPDSYGLYRRLQKFTHGEGYTVAARPLPFGVPISGSPNGTRSAAH